MSQPADSSPSRPAVPGFRDVRMRGFQDRTEVAAVRALLEERLRPLAVEEVDLHQAAGRVLAADITASVSVPPFDRAAMVRTQQHIQPRHGNLRVATPQNYLSAVA